MIFLVDHPDIRFALWSRCDVVDFASHLAYILTASLGALFFNHGLEEEQSHAKKLP